MRYVFEEDRSPLMVGAYGHLTVSTRPSIATVRCGWTGCAIVSLPLFLSPFASLRATAAVTELAPRPDTTRNALFTGLAPRNVDKNLLRKHFPDIAFDTRRDG